MTKNKNIRDLINKYKSFKKNAHVDLLSELNSYIENLIQQNKELREEIKSWNKEDVIQKLKDDIAGITKNSIYIRTDEELNEERTFMEEHYKICKGSVTYEVIGNGIGTWYVLECKKCRTKKEIINIENW